MYGIVGQAWCYDRWYVYTYTTDDLTCNNNYKHNTLYILSVQATVLLHEQVNGTYLRNVPICHESWDIAKQ